MRALRLAVALALSMVGLRLLTWGERLSRALVREPRTEVRRYTVNGVRLDEFTLEYEAHLTVEQKAAADFAVEFRNRMHSLRRPTLIPEARA
jgi:hypothetical protein